MIANGTLCFGWQGRAHVPVHQLVCVLVESYFISKTIIPSANPQPGFPGLVCSWTVHNRMGCHGKRIFFHEQELFMVSQVGAMYRTNQFPWPRSLLAIC
jgi:hypothetical protein